VKGVFIAAGLVALSGLLWGAHAQMTGGPGVTFSGTVPGQPSGVGSVGASATVQRSDAVARLVFQGTNVSTDASGNWSVTWGTSYISSTPLVLAKAVVTSGTQPITCEVTARSANTASGWCRQAATYTVSILGALVNIFANAPATGTAVMVFSREPTQ